MFIAANEMIAVATDSAGKSERNYATSGVDNWKKLAMFLFNWLNIHISRIHDWRSQKSLI